MVSRPTISRAPEQKTKVSQPTSVKKLREINDLQLHHIHGYRGSDGRNNLHFINDGAEIIYPAAATAVILNASTGNLSYKLML